MTVKVREILLARWKAAGKPLEGWVFAGAGDAFVNYSTIDSQHNRTLSRMKNVVPFRLYDLRHTALTRLGECGADQWTIQRIAGHTDIRTTSRAMFTPRRNIWRMRSRGWKLTTAGKARKYSRMLELVAESGAPQ